MVKRLTISTVLGKGLYDLNKITKFEPANSDGSEVIISETQISSLASLDRATYIIPRFVMLNNGSIVPAYIVFNHINSKANFINVLYVLSPNGLADITNDKDLIKYNISLTDPSVIKIFTAFDNEPSTRFIKNFYLGNSPKSSSNSESFLSEAYDDSVESKAIDIEFKVDTPIDLNYQFLFSNRLPQYSLVKRVDDSNIPNVMDLIENFCLMKFSNGAHVLGSIHRNINSKEIIGLSVIYNYVLSPIDISDLETYFGERDLNKLCPVSIYNFDINKEEIKLNLVHLVDLTAEQFNRLIDDSVDLLNDDLLRAGMEEEE